MICCRWGSRRGSTFGGSLNFTAIFAASTFSIPVPLFFLVGWELVLGYRNFAFLLFQSLAHLLCFELLCVAARNGGRRVLTGDHAVGAESSLAQLGHVAHEGKWLVPVDLARAAATLLVFCPTYFGFTHVCGFC